MVTIRQYVFTQRADGMIVVTVNGIPNMAGFHEFNEIFFDEVRVPVANRVGDEDAVQRSGVGIPGDSPAAVTP